MKNPNDPTAHGLVILADDLPSVPEESSFLDPETGNTVKRQGFFENATDLGGPVVSEFITENRAIIEKRIADQRARNELPKQLEFLEKQLADKRYWVSAMEANLKAYQEGKIVEGFCAMLEASSISPVGVACNPNILAEVFLKTYGAEIITCLQNKVTALEDGLLNWKKSHAARWKELGLSPESLNLL
jgi:hypothetical protein